MTDTNTTQTLVRRIERLVQEYISETRIAAQSAMDRAFANGTGGTAKKQPQHSRRRASRRRPSAELDALSERLYAATSNAPGETMMVLAPAVGCSARELQRPMALLKRAGRIRSVGRRQATRYYPMGEEPSSP